MAQERGDPSSRDVLDYISRRIEAPTIEAIRQSEARLQVAIRAVSTGGAGLGEPDVLSFRKSVAAATYDNLSKSVSAQGVITQAFVSFAPGPNFLVEVQIYRVRQGSEQIIIPTERDTVLVGDDALFAFDVNSIDVQLGDELRVDWYNYDGGNAHTVPVVLVIAKTAGG